MNLVGVDPDPPPVGVFIHVVRRSLGSTHDPRHPNDRLPQPSIPFARRDACKPLGEKQRIGDVSASGGQEMRSETSRFLRPKLVQSLFQGSFLSQTLRQNDLYLSHVRNWHETSQGEVFQHP